MSRQRYDNQQMRGERKKRAMRKVTELVKKGFRINPNKASDHYNQQVEQARRNRWAKK